MEEGNPLDLASIRVEFLLVVLAGADTTATVISSLFHYTSTVLAKIDNATAGGNLSAKAQYDEVLESSSYYVAWIRETLRLHPSFHQYLTSFPDSFPKTA